jgi:hypothetical protein
MTTVRRLKIERDSLKARVQELHGVIAASKHHMTKIAQWDALEVATSTIEGLVGGQNPVIAGGMRQLAFLSSCLYLAAAS